MTTQPRENDRGATPRVRLGELCALVNGDAYRSEDWSTTGVPIIRIQNLNDASKPFNHWSGPLEGRVAVRDGDVLLAWSGTPGTSFGAHQWNRGLAVLNQHIFRVDIDHSRLDPGWAVFAINEQLSRLIDKAHGGVGLRHVTKGECENLLVLTPPLPEQRRMAARLREFLDTAKNSTAAARKMTAELDALAAATIRSALAEPTPLFAAAQLLDEVSRGVGDEWRNYQVIGATRNGWGPAKEPVGKHPERYKLVEPGMVFYNPMRIMIGSIAAVFRPDQAGITSPDYVVVRPRPDRLDPVWFYEWLRSTQGARFIGELARGAVRERMLFNRLRKGTVPVPPLRVQQRVAECCSHVRAIQEEVASHLADLEALPAALLRETFGNAV